MDKISQFLQFAESLKLVRKAEAEISGNNIIDNIYTDLLPNNGVISRVNLPRTTIVIGRKGTGKSTIFQKSQKDIDQNKKFLSIYIDVKSLYDNSSPSFPAEIGKIPESNELVKYLVYSNFIKEIILKSKEKLKQRLERNYVLSVLGLNEISVKAIYEELDAIDSSIDTVFKQMNSSLITSFKNTIDKKIENKDELSASMGVKDGASVKANLSSGETNSIKKEFDNTLITYLDVKKCFIDNLIKVRSILKVKTLFIYLDDFSEIDKDAQILFMDWFIAPLNNLSEDFVKFKIATYPKRFYYGKLDNSKIDEISLDFFDAFYSYEKKSELIDISRMEHLALDYTKRLINNRLNVYFPDNNWEAFFDFKSEGLSELLFEVSLNNPRKIGYILSYCYESCLIHGSRITVNAIENAALRFYTDIIEKYFIVNEHICRPFEDKISNEHQYDLLIKIIKRQITNKDLLKRRKNKATSHFYINSKFSYLLDNLELNGFLSTYNKYKENQENFSTLYSLDYGLCKKYQLSYERPGEGRPGGKFTQPIFNFNNLIVDFFNSTQVIKCERNHEFPYSEINDFRKFKMKCPKCLDMDVVSKCEVTMKFKELKERFQEQEEKEKIFVNFNEFLILDFINTYQQPVSYIRLSEFLDMSRSTISINVKKIIDKGWCELDIELSKELNKDHVRITTKGIKLVTKVGELLKQFKEQVS